MRIPSIAVIVFLFETVPIAGVSTRINSDLCTVNFILFLLISIRFLTGAAATRFLFASSHASEIEKNVLILVVIAVVIRGVDNVEISEKSDGVWFFSTFLFNSRN